MAAVGAVASRRTYGRARPALAEGAVVRRPYRLTPIRQ